MRATVAIAVVDDLPNLVKSEAAAADYVARVNRAIDHVTRDLAAPLRLEDVARVACFSPYHFHRIFKTFTGETLAAFVKRLRLDRALYLMSHQPEMSLTAIAHTCGFSSSSDFSRSFKARHGVTPSSFDVTAHRARGRARLEGDTPVIGARLPIGANPDGFVARLVDLPPRTVVYRRVLRPFEGDGVKAATRALIAWAEARGLADGQWLGYMWDDPEIVPLERCRYDVGLVVPDGIRADGVFGVTRFPAFRVAEVDIAGALDLEQRAIDWLFGTWLPASGYSPAHQPAFEAWNGRPFAHGDAWFDLRAQLPIE